MRQPMQRRITLGVIAAMAFVPLPLLIIFVLDRDLSGTLGAAAALLLNSALLFAYHRGWDAARFLVVVTTTLLIGLSLNTPAAENGVHPVIALAPALALVLADWAWVVGAAVGVYAIATLRVGPEVYSSPEMIVSFSLVVVAMVLSRLSIDQALRAADANALAAGEQAAQAAEARDLARRQADDLARRNDEQRALLDLVATLETPAVTVADDILMAPIIGHFDSRRAEALTGRLLAAVGARRTRLLILDISGVAMVDSGVAAALDRLIQAVRLLGCAVTITGVAPAVAGALATLGAAFEGVDLAATPQQALDQHVVGRGI